MTLDALGLDKDKTLAFIAESKPGYLEFEAWVKANGSFDDAAVAAHNAGVTGYIHDDGTRGEIFAAVGATDDSCAFRDAVNLNNLDDWAIFHAQELA